ncbi:MAG: DUF503 domain-containing protein [Defluviitaleaceae bacterium]|nr:DUF503 domain-containing protein [Defluviitaleaceae bacterium]MCL2238392.1 DUF503 domain-containing protein [Defluviitaleaceae bacterium]
MSNNNFTASAALKFYIPQATSLKDKRQVRRSIIEKTRHKFNVSIAEIDTQDVMQTLTIGIAVVSGDAAHRQNSIDEIIRFMEAHADAELVSIAER